MTSLESVGRRFEKMRVSRLRRANNEQIRLFGQGLASARLRRNVVRLASLQLVTLKRNLNGFSSNLRSKNPPGSSSVLTESLLQLLGKSCVIFGLWMAAGWTRAQRYGIELSKL